MPTPDPIDTDRHALFVDFDGTLVSFDDDPTAVAIEPDALRTLERLQASLGGALAVVSGRRVADLDRFLAPLAFAAAGVHGLELRETPGGPVRRRAEPDDLNRVREALAAGLERESGLRLEDKGAALVLHYRGRPELKDTAETLMEKAVGGDGGLTVMSGHSIVEVHPAGMDKGAAVAALMRAQPFEGRVPVYVGDDRTDEFAFAEVARQGGVTVKVGDGETAAAFRLPDVAAVHAWLAAAVRGTAP